MKSDSDIRYETLLPFLSEERIQRFDAVLKGRTRHLSVVLENIYQSRNASAVMRSCDGMGIQDVHLIENINPWVYNRGVSKGTPSWLTLHRYRQQPDPTENVHPKPERSWVSHCSHLSPCRWIQCRRCPDRRTASIGHGHGMEGCI